MGSHQAYVDAIKDVAVKKGIDALCGEVVRHLPFLMWGPLGVITRYAITKGVEVLVRETEFAVFFKYIDLRVDAQGRDFSVAAVKNYQIQKTGTPEEIKKSEEELAQKFKQFISFSS